MHKHYLDPLLAPRSIAIFGASDRANAVGAIVYGNLLSNGFQGSVYAINPKHTVVAQRPCYARIRDIPAPVDLAVIATPAPTVMGILSECSDAGIKHAIVLTAGFREAGAEGKALETAIVEHARARGMRLIGPNCLGLLRPRLGLNATFSRGSARAGSLAFVSQSGALCTAILDWAEPRGIGFSAVVSLGNAADIDFGEVIDYLAFDGQTESILLYVEGIRDARSFLSSLRAAARLKPVILLKAGRHPLATQAAVTHTGALVGADDVFDAAVRRAGAVRAYTIGQLFAAASLLAAGMRTKGNRLAIISNGGGPAVMAVDRATEVGVTMAALSPSTLDALNARLPAHWSHANPVDILGDAPPERYGEALTVCLQDDGVDAALVMLTPQAMTEPDHAAQETIAARKRQLGKPVITCWMGDAQMHAAWRRLEQAGIPHFRTPENAVDAYGLMCAYEHNQALLLQTPPPSDPARVNRIDTARKTVEQALSAGATVLTAHEAKSILRDFNIAVTPTALASTRAETADAAQAVGFPVAIKIHHRELTHKSDVNGVRLHIPDRDAAARAYDELITAAAAAAPTLHARTVSVEPMLDVAHARELLVGVTRDPVFGPAIMFGAGGTAVEVWRDRAVTLPPLNRFIAQRLIHHTRIARLLAPFRNLPAVNMRALEDVLLRISDLVCELPEIGELDINPLIADERGAVVVDARMTIHPAGPDTAPYQHMAIHPFPAHIRVQWTLDDGTVVRLRPIRAEDALVEREFIGRLSNESKRLRFMQALQELTPAMLTRFTQIDYHREMALLALIDRDGREQEIGVGRYSTQPDGQSCEFAIVIADEWQHRGIGTRLLNELMSIARARGLRRIEGDVLADNHEMINMAIALGFQVETIPDDHLARHIWRDL